MSILSEQMTLAGPTMVQLAVFFSSQSGLH